MTDSAHEIQPPIHSLRQYTSAHVSLRRTGNSLATSEIVAFQLAHAQAQDAIHATLDPASLILQLRSEIPTLAKAPMLTLASAAPDRFSYLRRPDLGRALSPDSVALIAPHPCDIAIILADGLSATATRRHAPGLLSALLPLLTGFKIGPISIATQARVAISDHIGSLLRAHLTLILLGERPGLSSPDSLGAYLTWNPAPGRTDAERNCISNIRTGGLSYDTAAAKLLHLCVEARRLQLTGTSLKESTPALLRS